jgi:Neuraminidase (sialidase)
LYDFFDWITAPNSFGNPGNANNYQAAFVKSTDGRKTWTQPQVISRIRTTYVSDARTGAGIRTGDIIPEAVIDPANGYLYVVWQDSRFNSKNANFGTYDEVAFSMSKDGGATWSAPKRISTPTGEPAFTPSVRVKL